ncbi:MAG TPA: hypothetical protein VII20_03995 [Roseiarcus sp.]|jgi:hypothetical protein
MSWIALFLGLILALAGGAALAASIDLLPTELGILYATCGAIGLSSGFITIAIGLLIRRVDALRHLPSRSDARPPERPEPIMPPLVAGIEPVTVPEPSVVNVSDAEVSGFSPATAPEPSAMLDSSDDQEAPFNENLKEHLPSLDAHESVAAEPAPPKLVGRYGAGGANYSIFSDGSIEAETEQGAFKFASMSDFKAFIAAKRT